MDTRKTTSEFIPAELAQTQMDGDLERWDIDLRASRLRFVLRHLVLQRIEGEFHSWGGSLHIDRAYPELSAVHIWVDVASFDTGSAERDAHMRSAELLDVERLPRAEFHSTSFDIRADRAVLHGLLWLHGVTHDLDLEVGQQGEIGTPSEVSYSVKGTFNRQSFGLHWNQDLDVGGVVVGDEVDFSAEVRLIHIDDEAKRPPG